MGFFGPTEWYSQKDVDKRLAKAKANCESRIGMERQRYEASIRQIKDIQKALIERRIISDDARDEMRKGMERIAQMLCAASVDELNTYSPERLSVIPDEELAKWIIKDVKGQLDELRHAVRYNQTTQGLYEEEKARAERLQQQVDHLIKELKQTREDLKHEQTQASLARQALADAQNRLSVYASIPDVQAPAPDAAESAEQIAAVFRNTLPGWIQDWQRKPYYDRDFEFLRILATTGTPLRREAAEMLARKMDVESRSGSMSRMFARFEKMGLIELIKAKSSTQGVSTQHLLRLTTRGMDTARLIMSRDPAPSQLTELLARHKTPEHVLLNLEAAELLRDAMYTVDLFSSPIPINGDVEESERSYAPDLAATMDGQLLFIEVERGLGKAEKREAKWANCYDAIGGEFYVITADNGTMGQLKSEILFWLQRNGKDRKFQLWMTSISDAQGQGLRGEDIWSLKRSTR